MKDSILDGDGRVDQERIDTVGRMGGNWYVRAHGEALFEVAKPLQNPGVGIDQIHNAIRLSKILSGNDLGQLGNVHDIPNETEVNEYRLTELGDLFVELEDNPKELEERLHKMAKAHISKGNLNEAWMTLLSFNN